MTIVIQFDQIDAYSLSHTELLTIQYGGKSGFS